MQVHLCPFLWFHLNAKHFQYAAPTMKDVNGIGFELVLGRADWAEWTGLRSDDGVGRVVYDRDSRSARLRDRLEELQIPRGSSGGELLKDADRTSAARDRYGTWYWIDPEDRTRIRIRNSGDNTVDTFWPPDEDPALQARKRRGASSGSVFHPDPPESTPADRAVPLGALTITADHRLVVGLSPAGRDGGAPGLLVFDLHGGGPPRRLALRQVSRFDPVDAAPRPEGGFYLLDQASTEEGSPGRIWAFDRALQVEGPAMRDEEGATFGPVDKGGTEDREGSAGRSADGPFILPPAHSDVPARTLVVLPDRTLLVLFAGPSVSEGEERAVSRLLRYNLFPDQPGDDPLELRGEVRLDEKLTDAGVSQPEQRGWKAHDIAFLEDAPDPTESVRGRLYAVGGTGDQAFELPLWGDEHALEAELRKEEFPLRRFRGKALAAAGERVYYDFDERWLPLTPRPRHRFATRGQIVSPSFDSGISACTWHRLFVDGCIPSGASVRVESRAADRPDRLDDQPWRQEPELYLRDTGSEVPYHRPLSTSDREREGTGTWELLFQRAEGRYLQLRLTFTGDGRTSPSLHALRLYAPRFSYLDEYFPDVYQQDEESAHFFERYLANVEGTFTALEGQIAHAQTLFDTRTVPDEYLDWLGSWFGTDFDPALDDRRKRLLLDHAVELFNQRGTPRGLARMLTLALDPCVDESLFTRSAIASAVGRPEEAADDQPRQFGVRIVEQFAARGVPRASVGDAARPEQPTQIRIEETWTPRAGKEALDRRFSQFLRQRYAEDEEGVRRTDVWSQRAAFPPLLPSSTGEYASRKREDWRTFTRRVIEGPYAAIEADSVVRSSSSADPVTEHYRTFLRRRYGRIDRLAEKWADPPDRFDRIVLPVSELPTGIELRDWIDFVGFALPVHRTAHRFRVLVPVEPEEKVSVQQDRLNVARRIAEREKPAHTDVEVLPYWAAFRVGTGRTGLDTILGAGSRYSDLLVGRDALGDHTLGRSHPEDVADRRIAGRDRLDAPTPL